MNPHLHRPQTASCRPDRAFFWFLAGAFLWLGACRPLSPSGEEPRTPAEETTESRPPEEATDGSKEDASPQDPPQESRLETENRPESSPELATDLPTPEPCTTEGHKRCKATPETCTRLPSGLLAWSAGPACPSSSFCFRGGCLPFPQPVWVLRSHRGQNRAELTTGNRQLEVDKQGYAYFLTSELSDGTFGRFQIPPSQTSSAWGTYLVVATPQGQWGALEDISGRCKGVFSQLLLHPQGDVYLLCGGIRLHRLSQTGAILSEESAVWGDASLRGASFDSTGHLYVSGMTDRKIFDGTPHEISSPSREIVPFLAKYNSQRQLLWTRALPSSVEPRSFAFQLDSQETLWIHGSFNRSASFGSFSLQAASSASFFARLSPEGSWLSARSFPKVSHLGMKPSPQGLPLLWGYLSLRLSSPTSSGFQFSCVSRSACVKKSIPPTPLATLGLGYASASFCNVRGVRKRCHTGVCRGGSPLLFGSLVPEG